MPRNWILATSILALGLLAWLLARQAGGPPRPAATLETPSFEPRSAVVAELAGSAAAPRAPESQPARVALEERESESQPNSVLPRSEAPSARQKKVEGEPPRFYCRVLAEDGAPISEARVETFGWRPDGYSDLLTATDAEGLFVVHVPPDPTLRARVEARGFGTVLVPIVDGFESPATAQTVRLRPSARVVGRVVTELRLSDISVAVTARSFDLVHPKGNSMRFVTRDVPWSAELNADGSFEFADLPPGVNLTLTLSMEGEVLLRNGEPLVLDPGEVRQVEYEIGLDGVTLTGSVVDEMGNRVPELPLWLVPATRDGPTFLSAFNQGQVHARRSTDLDGRFRFEGVPPGSWWLGPAPLFRKGSNVAGIARPILLQDHELEREIELSVDRGLYISGRVVDWKGHGLAGCTVRGVSREAGGGPRVTSGAGGEFRLGPLVRGRYWLYAGAPEDGFGSTARGDAQAGQNDVLLELGPAGTLRGRLVDDQGVGVMGQVHLIAVQTDGRARSQGRRVDRKGLFEFSNLDTGTYRLLARTVDVRFALVEDIHIEEGQVAEEITARVRPAARLRILSRFPQREGRYRLEVDGAQIAHELLPPGGAAVETTPPGRVRCSFTMDGQPVITRELVLSAGEEREIEFAPP